ncbi:hypothetical protein NCS56_00190800 [Fusarium sp. Ph1]|nr:hypothetical protein NCS56_00190800 [Fusarium sp. Ph1]
MVLTLGIVALAFAAFCGAKDTAPSEAQRLAVIFEKSKITDTVLTTVYDIEDNDKKFHCAACSNKLTISDLKLDVEFNVDDYGHGTLRVSESEFVIDATSKIISGISCSTSYSKSHVRAECVLPLNSHHKPLGRPFRPHDAVDHLYHPHRPHHLDRPHHPHHPHFRYRVGPQLKDNLPKYTGYVPIHQQVERPYPVKPDPIPHPVDDSEDTRPYSHRLGRGSSEPPKTYPTISKRGEMPWGGCEVNKYADRNKTLPHWNC